MSFRFFDEENKKLASLPSSRSAAEKSGIKFFFTGQPCVKWHRTKRSTKTGRCCKCRNISKKKYKYRDKIAANKMIDIEDILADRREAKELSEVWDDGL